MPVDDPDDDPDDELLELWREASSTLIARCAAVRDAAATADPEMIAGAHDAAHKLAGAVGMFGFVHASALAIRLDELVRGGALEGSRRAEVDALAEELAIALEAGP